VCAKIVTRMWMYLQAQAFTTSYTDAGLFGVQAVASHFDIGKVCISFVLVQLFVSDNVSAYYTAHWLLCSVMWSYLVLFMVPVSTAISAPWFCFAPWFCSFRLWHFINHLLTVQWTASGMHYCIWHLICLLDSAAAAAAATSDQSEYPGTRFNIRCPGTR